MTVAEYFSDGKLKALISDDRRDGYLKIKLAEKEECGLVIGKRLYKVKNGAIILKPSELPSGELSAKLYFKDRTVFLESLLICDKEITMSKSTTRMLLEMRGEQICHAERLSALSEELSKLKHKISKGITF